MFVKKRVMNKEQFKEFKPYVLHGREFADVHSEVFRVSSSNVHLMYPEKLCLTMTLSVMLFNSNMN